jgi:hypothetical protein
MERLALMPHGPRRMPRTRRILGPDGQEHEAEPIGFRASGEHFNEYLLDDGSILRIKLVRRTCGG